MENNLNKLLEQATAAHTTRRFGLAHRLYESALGLDPDNVEVNRLVGLMNSETGDYAKALPYFEKVLSRDEFNGEIWLAYANTLRKLDRLEEAQVALNFVKKIRSRSDVDHNTVDSFIFDAGKNTNRSLASQSLEVGKHSYGVTDKNIVWDGYQYNSSGEKIKPRLLIGRFCSIGEGAKFFLGGNHRYDWVSTYPFHVQSVHSSTYNALPSEIPGYGQTNGDIIVGNDVWFGENVTVMSGVNIGDGAVVAANSTVTSDVIPYSIVGGNPARLIKYRFDKVTIEALLEIKWWNLDDAKLNQLIPLLVQPDVNNFIEKYRLMIAT